MKPSKSLPVTIFWVLVAIGSVLLSLLLFVLQVSFNIPGENKHAKV